MGQLRWPFIAPCGKAALRSRTRSRAPSFDNALGEYRRGRFRLNGGARLGAAGVPFGAAKIEEAEVGFLVRKHVGQS